METEIQEKLQKIQRNGKYPKISPKIISKNLETTEITQSNQIKNKTIKPKLHQTK